MARASAALRGRFGHLVVPRRSQRLAPREERPDTAVTAESARRSNFALRADGSWRSAATARRWTSSRASGSAMASSSHVRSRADRKTHMLSFPSSSRLEAGPWPPGADVRDSYRTELSISALPTARLGYSRACPLSSRRYPQRGALITTPERLVLARGDEHDIVQFLAAEQDGDQDFCFRPPPHQVGRPSAAPPGETYTHAQRASRK
jgi:hypothetical protein